MSIQSKNPAPDVGVSDSAAQGRKPLFAGSGFLGRAVRTPAFIAGVVMTAILVAVAIAAPLLTNYDPTSQDLADILADPSSTHWLGTDQLGRDLYARLIYATRTNLSIASLAVIIPFVVGTLAGLIAGYFGGWIDWLISRVIDTFIAFPFYVMVIAVVFAVGVGVRGVFIAFALVGWVLFARVIRSSTRVLAGSGWVVSARGLGYSHGRVLLRHLLPNVLPQAVVLLMTQTVLIMVAIVTLGYLGLGVQPPTPDWGTMMSDGQAFIHAQWWLSTVPGLAVVYTGIALSMLGDGLSDIWRTK